jgi:hypothetical protein
MLQKIAAVPDLPCATAQVVNEQRAEALRPGPIERALSAAARPDAATRVGVARPVRLAASSARASSVLMASRSDATRTGIDAGAAAHCVGLAEV